MARFDLLQVNRIKLKLVLAEQWARHKYMRHVFFSKNCANTEPQSIYAISIFNEGNNHSLPTLLWLAVEPCKH